MVSNLLLKQSSLNDKAMTSYRLISNLLFISKICIRVVSVQIMCSNKSSNKCISCRDCNQVGLPESVLNWFKIYIKEEKFYIEGHVSEIHDICSEGCRRELPWLLFSLHKEPLGDITREHSICSHSYVYIPVEPNDAAAVNSIDNWLLAINT